MALDARKRVPAIDILQNDYEYCTINRKSESGTNDLGEPTFTVSEVDTDVKCAIDPLLSPGVPPMIREMLPQGEVITSFYYLTLLADQDIEPDDTVVDVDGNEYAVLNAINWYTHKSAIIKLQE
jgi:hypothetical protein